MDRTLQVILEVSQSSFGLVNISIIPKSSICRATRALSAYNNVPRELIQGLDNVQRLDIRMYTSCYAYRGLLFTHLCIYIGLSILYLAIHKSKTRAHPWALIHSALDGC